MLVPENIDLSKKPILKRFYDFTYWFQRTFQRKKLIRKAAIHESGHIVFSYFYGFTVPQSSLLIDAPGNGFTETAYGKNMVAANIIFNHWVGEYGRQSDRAKEQIISIALHLMVILFAGSAGEAFLKRRKNDRNYYLVISGEDLVAINQIDHFLVTVGAPSAQRGAPENVFEFFEQFPIFKQAIQKLAERFMAAPDLHLTQTEIEAALNSVDFFTILEEIINPHRGN